MSNTFWWLGTPNPTALHTPLQGSSQTLRLGGSARFVTLIGLGLEADEAKAHTWGATVFQAAGAALAKECKANKAKSAAISVCGGSAADAKTAVEVRVAFWCRCLREVTFAPLLLRRDIHANKKAPSHKKAPQPHWFCSSLPCEHLTPCHPSPGPR